MTTPTSATALAGRRWRWTADAYEKAAEMGLFGPYARAELLEGEVYTIAPMLPGHSKTLRKLARLASRQLDPALWAVGCQVPVRLDDDTEPEPDLWIANGPDDRYGDRHPGPHDLVLLVEVADTSLAWDKGQKIPAYAAAGVAYAWLISLPDNTLTSYSNPLAHQRRYELAEEHRAGDTVFHPPTGLLVDLAQLI